MSNFYYCLRKVEKLPKQSYQSILKVTFTCCIGKMENIWRNFKICVILSLNAKGKNYNISLNLYNNKSSKDYERKDREK